MPPKRLTEVRSLGRERLEIRIPANLHAWVVDYANRKKTTVTQVIIDHLVKLQKEDEDVAQF